MSAATAKNLILVGAITGVHGLLGDVKIKAFINEIHLLTKGTTLIDDAGNNYTLQKTRTVGQKKLAFKFTEITDRTAAEKLIGTDLFLDPTTFDTEQFEPDIIGQSILNQAGESVGIITNIFDNGAHEVLEIETPNGTEVLIPYTDIHTTITNTHISLTADGEACLDV